jgi:hypothetical protein
MTARRNYSAVWKSRVLLQNNKNPISNISHILKPIYLLKIKNKSKNNKIYIHIMQPLMICLLNNLLNKLNMPIRVFNKLLSNNILNYKKKNQKNHKIWIIKKLITKNNNLLAMKQNLNQNLIQVRPFYRKKAKSNKSIFFRVI